MIWTVTVDTDIVALDVAYVKDLKVAVWLAFGVGKCFTYTLANRQESALGPFRSIGWLFFHTFSGSDNASSFTKWDKKSAFGMWNLLPEATPVFQKLSSVLDEINAEEEAVVERCTGCEQLHLSFV